MKKNLSSSTVSTGAINRLHFIHHLSFTTRHNRLTGECVTNKNLGNVRITEKFWRLPEFQLRPFRSDSKWSDFNSPCLPTDRHNDVDMQICIREVCGSDLGWTTGYPIGSEVLTAPSMKIGAMMEAASTSETSVNFYQTTRRNIPEESQLHTRRSENLISHLNHNPSWKTANHIRKSSLHIIMNTLPIRSNAGNIFNLNLLQIHFVSYKIITDFQFFPPSGWSYQ
jgi:hypothetical protein